MNAIVEVVEDVVGGVVDIVEDVVGVVGDEAQLLQQLPKVASLQVAWLLVYFCAVPRINHL